jgi:hypothetical protein
MPRRFERLDQALGRLVFRFFGTLLAIMSLACLYGAYRYATDWYAGSPMPALMFGLIAVAAGSVVPYAFSRKRTLTEAFDAMEGGVGDQVRPPKA